MDTIYAVDENFVQISPIFSRNSQSAEHIDKLNDTLKKYTHLDGKEHYLSSPYISTKSNKYVITLVIKVEDRLIALDFDLYKLLQDFNYTGFMSKLFLFCTKCVYGIIGLSLALFAVILVCYAIYDFLKFFTDQNMSILQSSFKSLIALTLGLAIFDLAKNLLEHEVVLKDYHSKAHGGNELLVKFLISIVIALSIEALMMVFKIAVNDYRDILYAVYLLLAVGFVLISLSQFNKHLPKSGRQV